MRKFLIHRKRGAPLGLLELIAIALGGMIGGGIFTVLGISASIVGAYTPFAIFLGGLIAALAAYSYVKLGVYYKDEGATYSFMKKVFPRSPFAASLIGWWVIFGYISTLALYAYTFSSYALSAFPSVEGPWMRKFVAWGIITLFAIINLSSVRGMGKIEDLMVYIKLIILTVISFLLINNSTFNFVELLHENGEGIPYLGILICASVTFVAYEGFQLVINAVNEMDHPERNIPAAIYSAIALAIGIYVIIALGAILTIPMEKIIANKEAALAAGAKDVIGLWGRELIILGALLATCSAISGTVFGASRQMAVIAEDGYFPRWIGKRRHHIPDGAIVCMSLCAFLLILLGELRIILEYGSITFLLVSLLMAVANFKVRKQTQSSTLVTLISVFGLCGGVAFIFYYELKHHPEQMLYICSLYISLSLAAWFYSWSKN